MKLWSVGVDIRSEDAEEKKRKLLDAVMQMRVFGPGTLSGSEKGLFNVIFAKAAESASDIAEEIQKRMPGEHVLACKLPQDEDWTGCAEDLGVNEDALRSMADVVYGSKEANGDAVAWEITNSRRKKPGGGIVFDVSVEGIDEAVRMLKVLDAQLRGVQSQAHRIADAIDKLQLKLEGRIRSMTAGEGC